MDDNIKSSITSFIRVSGRNESTVFATVSSYVNAASSRLQFVVGVLEQYLTSVDEDERNRALQLLNGVFRRIPRALTVDQLTFLVKFYAGKLTDPHCVEAACDGLHLLHQLHDVADKKPKLVIEVLKCIFENVQVQGLRTPSRRSVFRLIKYFWDVHRDECVKMDTDFVFGVLQAMDGERDPRCLADVFTVFTGMSSECPGHVRYAEDLVDAVICYFPIQDLPPFGETIATDSSLDIDIDKYNIVSGNDAELKRFKLLSYITNVTLRELLYSAFVSSTQYGSFVLSFLVAKITSTLAATRTEALRATRKAILAFDLNDADPFIEKITLLSLDEVILMEDETVKQACIELESAACEKLAEKEDSLKKYLHAIIMNCSKELFNNPSPNAPGRARVSKALLLSVAGTSAMAYKIILDTCVFPICEILKGSRDQIKDDDIGFIHWLSQVPNIPSHRVPTLPYFDEITGSVIPFIYHSKSSWRISALDTISNLLPHCVNINMLCMYLTDLLVSRALHDDDYDVRETASAILSNAAKTMNNVMLHSYAIMMSRLCATIGIPPPQNLIAVDCIKPPAPLPDAIIHPTIVDSNIASVFRTLARYCNVKVDDVLLPALPAIKNILVNRYDATVTISIIDLMISAVSVSDTRTVSSLFLSFVFPVLQTLVDRSMTSCIEIDVVDRMSLALAVALRGLATSGIVHILGQLVALFIARDTMTSPAPTLRLINRPAGFDPLASKIASPSQLSIAPLVRGLVAGVGDVNSNDVLTLLPGVCNVVLATSHNNGYAHVAESMAQCAGAICNGVNIPEQVVSNTVSLLSASSASDAIGWIIRGLAIKQSKQAIRMALSMLSSPDVLKIMFVMFRSEVSFLLTESDLDTANLNGAAGAGSSLTDLNEKSGFFDDIFPNSERLLLYKRSVTDALLPAKRLPGYRRWLSDSILSHVIETRKLDENSQLLAVICPYCSPQEIVEHIIVVLPHLLTLLSSDISPQLQYGVLRSVLLCLGEVSQWSAGNLENLVARVLGLLRTGVPLVRVTCCDVLTAIVSSLPTYLVTPLSTIVVNGVAAALSDKKRAVRKTAAKCLNRWHILGSSE